MYLAVVIDLFSRKVVGWSMQDNMRKGLVIDALEMAIKSRKPGPDLIAHELPRFAVLQPFIPINVKGTQYDLQHEWQR